MQSVMIALFGLTFWVGFVGYIVAGAELIEGYKALIAAFVL